ncbi:acyltransferase [Streptosporangium sp. NPDC020072]|uniref:acyltransferase family protein n=1 Tax=Streptosporangium sp. NPDC020072 TaxID=3154788 RepID=UPI003438AB5E
MIGPETQLHELRKQAVTPVPGKRGSWRSRLFAIVWIVLLGVIPPCRSTASADSDRDEVRVKETMAPPAVREKAPRLPSLTGLRWFAAFAVFGFHLFTGGITDDPGTQRFLGAVFSAGSSGVPFFFVLSGMVLTWSSRPGDRAWAFWRRRAARIVPSHMVTWIAVLALLTVAGRAVAPGPAVSGFFLLQAWVPDETYYFGGNTPSWSLSCEMAFYAAFPLLLPLLRRIPGNRLLLTSAGLWAGTWVVPFVSFSMPESIGYWFVWIFPVTRALEFALGMTVALMVKEGRWRGPGLPVAVVLVLVAYATVPLVWQRAGWVAWMAGPFAVLIAAAATADVREKRSPLRLPVLVWLGEISFAFYLVHQPTISLVNRVLGRTPAHALLVTLTALPLAVLLAWALHRLVERPAERLLSGGRPGAA